MSRLYKKPKFSEKRLITNNISYSVIVGIIISIILLLGGFIFVKANVDIAIIKVEIQNLKNRYNELKDDYIRKNEEIKKSLIGMQDYYNVKEGKIENSNKIIDNNKRDLNKVKPRQ